MYTTSEPSAESSEFTCENQAMSWTRTNLCSAVQFSPRLGATRALGAPVGDTGGKMAGGSTGTGPTTSRNPTPQAPLNTPEALAATAPRLNKNA